MQVTFILSVYKLLTPYAGLWAKGGGGGGGVDAYSAVGIYSALSSSIIQLHKHILAFMCMLFHFVVCSQSDAPGPGAYEPKDPSTVSAGVSNSKKGTGNFPSKVRLTHEGTVTFIQDRHPCIETHHTTSTFTAQYCIQAVIVCVRACGRACWSLV